MKSFLNVQEKNWVYFPYVAIFLIFLLWPFGVSAQYVQFSDVSQSAGVAKPDSGTGHGVVFGDFNGDGLLDIYMVNWWYQPNFLFINNGNGTFTNKASQFGVTVPEGGDRGVGAADYDNDGDLDLYISAGGQNSFFRNDNNTHYTNVTYSSGVSDWGQGMNVCFGDYDNDGFVDLLITNQGSGRNELFHNNGDHSFSKVTDAVGLGNNKYSNGAAFFDYDNDGYLDIIIIRGRREENFSSLLYHNNRNGTFSEVGSNAGIAEPGDGLGVAIGDYNNDGYLDLYVTEEWQHNRLYRNNGNGTFTNVASEAGVDDPGRNVGCTFGDFNNDGWLDIYETTFGGNNRLYRNNGDGTFSEVGAYAGVDDWQNGFGVTIGDYNRDGWVDIFLSNAGQRAKLYRNGGNGNHWLALKLIGEESNRSAIGARVVAYAGGKRQIREICAGSSYVSENSLEVYFGVGSSTEIDSLFIHWPSGIRQRFYNLAVNQYKTISESENSSPPPSPNPQLSVDPPQLNFGYTSTSAAFHIANKGQGNLEWQISESGNAPWLVQVSPLSGENDADVTVQIDRSNLAPGVYEDSLWISSNGGNKSLQIIVKVEDSENFNLRVVAGGDDYTDSEGKTWAADKAYTPGDWGYVGGKSYFKNNTIQNTDDPYLYQTERYGMSAYRFNVPDGLYTIILHFAEIYWNAAGKRLFNVALEDSLVLDHYDIYAHVGKNNAVYYAYTVPVQDGILDIDFTTFVDNAKISAIEIIGLGNSTPPGSSPQLSVSAESLNFTPEISDTTFIIQNAGGGDLSWNIVTDSLPNWISVSPPSGGNYSQVSVHVDRTGMSAGIYHTGLKIVSNGGQAEIPVSCVVPGQWVSLYRINVGGEQYQDSTGILWLADQPYSQGGWGYVGGTPYFRNISISNTSNDPLYQTERFDMQKYQFDVPNGYYRVTLKMAEIFWKEAGKRIFNVFIEGNPILSHYDIFAEVGYATAVKKIFLCQVTDHQLNIDFENLANFNKLSAIEVDVMSGSSSGPVLVVEPNPIDFGTNLNEAYLHIQNMSEDSLHWEIHLDPDSVQWIANVSQLSGVNEDSVKFTINRNNLPPGYYHTSFQITSNGGTADIVLKMQVVDSTHFTVRVNAGASTDYVDTSGKLWQADQTYAQGEWGYEGGVAYFKNLSIQGTNDDSLYRTERYGNFVYRFSVPNGNYHVTLYFAEIYWHEPGSRLFSAKINDQQVLTDYDIFSEVGFATATQKSFDMAVNSGEIKIDFWPTIDNAKISAIEIEKVSSVAKNKLLLSERNISPAVTKLIGNYPNPFNPTTEIQFQLSKQSRTTVSIFNILGKEVCTLIQNKTLATGMHSVRWTATDKNGLKVPSGVYFCRLVASPVSGQKISTVQTIKMLLSR